MPWGWPSVLFYATVIQRRIWPRMARFVQRVWPLREFWMRCRIRCVRIRSSRHGSYSNVQAALRDASAGRLCMDRLTIPDAARFVIRPRASSSDARGDGHITADLDGSCSLGSTDRRQPRGECQPKAWEVAPRSTATCTTTTPKQDPGGDFGGTDESTV